MLYNGCIKIYAHRLSRRFESLIFDNLET
ncbi:hypothetical protein A6L64_06820 [Neisseria meningitidis]|nr:hypothetical protein A6L64_06820 [Neisseria meningitidis]